MKSVDMKIIYKTIRQYASVIGRIPQDAPVEEICDFGDSYGFLFKIEDRFANLYWCVEKDTYKPFSFRPNMDMKKFTNRKILPHGQGEIY